MKCLLNHIDRKLAQHPRNEMVNHLPLPLQHRRKKNKFKRAICVELLQPEV